MASDANEWAAARGDKWARQLSGMEGMLATVVEPLLQGLNINKALRVADIGCGGGGTTFEILRRAPVGSVVHGFDISPALVDVANKRKMPGDDGIAFMLADMGTTPPPDVLYDRLASRFGIMFFDDPAAAFSNLLRWVAPGGQFAFAAWGPLAENLWMMSARQVAAELIQMPAPKPDEPGPFRYADADKLLALLRGAGWRELAVNDWRGDLPVGGGLPAAEAANFALAAFSSFGDLLAEAGADVLERGRQMLTERFAREEREGVVRMQASVHIFTGVRAK